MIVPAVPLSIFVLVCTSIVSDARPPTPSELDSNSSVRTVEETGSPPPPTSTTERPIARRMLQLRSTSASALNPTTEAPRQILTTERPRQISTTAAPRRIVTTAAPRGIRFEERPLQIRTTERPLQIRTTERPRGISWIEPEPLQIGTTQRPRGISWIEPEPLQIPTTAAPRRILTTAAPRPSEPARTRNRRNGDFVESEEEFQRVLDDLRDEAERGTGRTGRPVEFNVMQSIEEANRRDADTARARNEKNGMAANGAENKEGLIECTVCLDDIEEGQFERQLRCGHTFHQNCIDHWFQTRGRMTCPTCRQVDTRYQ